MKIQIPKNECSNTAQRWRRYFFGSMCVLSSMFSTTSFAANYTSTIESMQWDHVSCLFFRLTNVTQADPINPNSPWFAIPGTLADYAQVYALLLSAKVAGSTVNVITTGSAAGGACGVYAGVSVVTLQ